MGTHKSAKIPPAVGEMIRPFCFKGGQVKLELIPSPPEPLNSLMKGDTPKSRKFLNHIRMVNSAFQMTSFRANQIKLGFGSYKVQGQVYHTMGPLKNSPGQDAKFVQIYFMDNSDEETERRCEIFPEVDKELISELQKLLHANNSLIQKFKMALEMDDSFASAKVVIRAEKCPRGEHKGRFNAPSSNEIGGRPQRTSANFSLFLTPTPLMSATVCISRTPP